MMTKVQCAHCSQHYEVTSEDIGKTVTCQMCGKDFVAEQANTDTQDLPEESSQAIIPCPCCGEQILSIAKKCKHCGEFLDGRGIKAQALKLGKKGIPVFFKWAPDFLIWIFASLKRLVQKHGKKKALAALVVIIVIVLIAHALLHMGDNPKSDYSLSEIRAIKYTAQQELANIMRLGELTESELSDIQRSSRLLREMTSKVQSELAQSERLGKDARRELEKAQSDIAEIRKLQKVVDEEIKKAKSDLDKISLFRKEASTE